MEDKHPDHGDEPYSDDLDSDHPNPGAAEPPPQGSPADETAGQSPPETKRSQASPFIDSADPLFHEFGVFDRFEQDVRAALTQAGVALGDAEAARVLIEEVRMALSKAVHLHPTARGRDASVESRLAAITAAHRALRASFARASTEAGPDFDARFGPFLANAGDLFDQERTKYERALRFTGPASLRSALAALLSPAFGGSRERKLSDAGRAAATTLDAALQQVRSMQQKRAHNPLWETAEGKADTALLRKLVDAAGAAYDTVERLSGDAPARMTPSFGKRVAGLHEAVRDFADSTRNDDLRAVLESLARSISQLFRNFSGFFRRSSPAARDLAPGRDLVVARPGAIRPA